MAINIARLILFLIFVPSVCEGIPKTLEAHSDNLSLHSKVEKYQNVVSQDSETPFEDMLETVKGTNIEYMTERFGYPSRDFLGPNKNRVFEYHISPVKKDKTLEKLLSGMVDASLGVPLFSHLIKLSSDRLDCSFWFEVNREDIVRKWRWQGKGCEEIYRHIKDISKSSTLNEDDINSDPILFGEFQIFVSEKKLGSTGLYPKLGAHILIKRENITIVDETPEIAGDFTSSWVTDMDGDQNPEIIIWVREYGIGNYGHILLYAIYENTLLKYELPPLTKEQKEGYMGLDQFTRSTTNIIRKYKIYNKSDPNCCPTGGTAELAYSYDGIKIFLERFSRLD